jgi:DNA-binding CsgD family transcriptional regulator
MYTSPDIAGILVDDYVHTLSNGHGSSRPTLILREREVLQLIAEGKTTKQIALILHVSPKTIEATRLKIMKKLELDSIAELTKYAIREGLIYFES